MTPQILEIPTENQTDDKPTGKHQVVAFMEEARAAEAAAVDTEGEAAETVSVPASRIQSAPPMLKPARVCTSAEQKLDALIAKKRAPFETRHKHYLSIRSKLSAAQAMIDAYHEAPTENGLGKALSAAANLAGANYLLERFGTVDIDENHRLLLNESVDLAPALLELAEEEMAYLKDRKGVLRTLRIEEASLYAPNVPFSKAVREFGVQIAVREQNLQDYSRTVRIAGTSLSFQTGNYSPHPFFPSLLLYSSKVIAENGIVNGSLEIEYRGLNPSLNVIPPPVYSLNRGTGTEPLSTHWRWSNKANGGSQVGYIAGTPSQPQNGALFTDPQTGMSSQDDATGVFSGWPLTSPFYGIESYLSPGMTWEASYVSYDQPNDGDVYAVGSIVDPDGSPPTPPGFQWIYMGLSFTNNAGLFSIKKSWKCFQGNTASTIIYSIPGNL